MESTIKNRTLTLEYYRPHEMACLKEGDHVLHYGNNWDFHAGCHGTAKRFADGSRINFSDVWDDSIRYPDAVAKMIAAKIGADIVIVERTEPFP
jgi:hypothetical protein